jgi:hypothetical protein
LAVLTEDALGVLDDVEVGKYHEYEHTYATAGAPGSRKAKSAR